MKKQYLVMLHIGGDDWKPVYFADKTPEGFQDCLTEHREYAEDLMQHMRKEFPHMTYQIFEVSFKPAN